MKNITKCTCKVCGSSVVLSKAREHLAICQPEVALAIRLEYEGTMAKYLPIAQEGKRAA